MKVCPSCLGQVAPHVQLCPFCAFSFVTGEKRVVVDHGPNAMRCAACSSPVTKGMRCIRCGVTAGGGTISLQNVAFVIVSVIAIAIAFMIYLKRQ